MTPPEPPADRAIRLIASRAQKIEPWTLTAKVRARVSSVRSTTVVAWPMIPALLTRSETGPSFSSHSRNSRATSALSATSADLVEQELRGCRKRERESRFKDVRRGTSRSFRSAPFQPPVVGSPEADGGMVSDALQGIGMVHDAPPLDYAQVVHNCRTRSSKRVMESGAAHSSKRGRR